MSEPALHEDARLAAALWETGGWEAPTIAAAVVGPEATLATIGPGDHPFRLASVTKLLAAYACLVAVEEGTIELDEPTGPPGVTVRHLLSHAGGYGFDGGIVLAPERKRIYSNAGFDALGDHLAERAAMAAGEYVRLAVFEPLAMHHTELREPSLAHGGWSTGADLARFAGELLRPTLVHPTTLAEATRVAFADLDGIVPGVGPQSPNDWGLGFEIRGHKRPHWTGRTNSPATFGHFGAAGGFLWVDPAIDRSLVVLTDRSFGPWALDAWPPLADAVVAATLGDRLEASEVVQ
jgi:CubicO group peptidase (beta-lactamase class C family)